MEAGSGSRIRTQSVETAPPPKFSRTRLVQIQSRCSRSKQWRVSCCRPGFSKNRRGHLAPGTDSQCSHLKPSIQGQRVAVPKEDLLVAICVSGALWHGLAGCGMQHLCSDRSCTSQESELAFASCLRKRQHIHQVSARSLPDNTHNG